jgi:hypothetical protein
MELCLQNQNLSVSLFFMVLLFFFNHPVPFSSLTFIIIVGMSLCHERYAVMLYSNEQYSYSKTCISCVLRMYFIYCFHNLRICYLRYLRRIVKWCEMLF